MNEPGRSSVHSVLSRGAEEAAEHAGTMYKDPGGGNHASKKDFGSAWRLLYRSHIR